MKKRWLAVMLSICMMLSFPGAAFASEGETTEDPAVESTEEVSEELPEEAEPIDEVLPTDEVAPESEDEEETPDSEATSAEPEEVPAEESEEPVEEESEEIQLAADDDIASGTWGENETWVLDSSNVLTIEGTGPMEDYKSGAPWESYSSQIFQIVIGDGVTSIGPYAFRQCFKLERVVVPESVTSIGNHAFIDCWKMTEISIPDTVTSIGDSAFLGCEALAEITIPNGITIIENKAFASCSGATSITIPNGVTSIGESAFSGCDSVTSITIPDSVTSIGANAFDSCSSLTHIDIPTSVTSIGNAAFAHCNSLTNIIIPDSVTYFGSGMFEMCYELKSATIPSRVTTIGRNTFFESGLTSFTIPNRVTTIEAYAFRFCDGLTSITMPVSITNIGNYAFSDCNSLTDVYYAGTEEDRQNITISSNNGPLQNATWHCSLASGSCGDGITWALYDDGLLLISGNGLMDDYADETPWAAYTDSITHAEIKEGVTSIGSSIFAGCSNLASAVLPVSLTSIGIDAFAACSSLADIYYDGNEEDQANILISGGNDALQNAEWHFGSLAHIVSSGECGEEVEWKLDEDGNLIISGNGRMNDYYGERPWDEYVDSIICVIIEDGITYVGENAFSDCSALTDVTLADSITSIGNYAFSSCTKLKNISISDSLESIGESAFYNCSSLSSLSIPDSVTYIGMNAFNACSSLMHINIPNSLTIIESETFFGCANLTDISIPSSIVSIESAAFADCVSLTSISIPDSVTSIGEGIFSNCIKLSDVELPQSITRIEKRAFYNCYGLKNIDIPSSVTIIENEAFSDCDNLLSVTFDVNVKRIGNSAFSNCESLNTVYYSGSESDRANLVIGSGNNQLQNAVWIYNAADIVCGDDLTWSLSSEGTLTIHGSGPMYDFSKAPWYSNRNLILQVEIADGVTSIGEKAFYQCEKLNSITIPETVTSIGNQAFYYCSNLTEIIIPSSVNFIGNGAFYSCRSITNITIPEGITSIGDSVFNNCTALTSIVIPDTVTSFGNYAFGGCGMISFTIPASVTSIGNCVFSNCRNLSNITISNGVTSIGNEVFTGCSAITSVTIPASVTSIGKGLFYACHELNDLDVDPDNEKYDSREGCNAIIETETNRLIAGCKNTVIPHSVTTIGASAFYGCYEFDHFVIPEGVKIIEREAFSYCNNMRSISIPSSVTQIGSSAFEMCEQLEDVYYAGTEEEWDTIEISGANYYLTEAALHFAVARGTCGANLTWSLSENGILDISGSGPMDDFADAAPWSEYKDFMEQVVINDGVTHIGDWAFCDCGISAVSIPSSVKSIGNNAFNGCGVLQSITLPDGLMSIGDHAFFTCISLQKITIPEGITDIGAYTFGDCEWLGEIIIPASVTSIGSGAFSGCGRLTDIYFARTEEERSNVTIESDNDLLLNATWHYKTGACGDDVLWSMDDAGVLSIDGGGEMHDNAGETTTWIAEPESVTEIVISDGVTSIGAGVFADCTNLTTVTIPASVTSIGDGAFGNGEVSASGDAITTLSGSGSLTDVYYGGTEADWNKLVIGADNEALLNAEWHYEFHKLEKVEALAPTCTENGHIEHYACKFCSAVYADPEMQTPLSAADLVVPATGHKFDTKITKATLKANGKKESICAHCGEVESTTTIYRPTKFTLSATQYTYNGKTRKPTVKVVGANGKTISSSNYSVKYASGLKKIGQYSVTITFKGSNYTGKKVLYFTIVPKGTSISSISASSKGFTVKWKKQTSQTTGYQIRYSLKSSMASAKTVTISKNTTLSKKITKLKAKKTYYVQVRTYKKVGSKYYYSSWSAKKKVTTKK